MAIVLAACGQPGGAPRLIASWSVVDTGQKNKPPESIAAPARARWCGVADRLEVEGVQGDLAFGLVIYPESTLEAGTYPVFDPGIGTVHRPGAAGAVRWFTDRLVAGYQSDSGSLELTRQDAKVRMQFGMRLRSLRGDDTIRAAGRVEGIAPGACDADSVPNTAPRQ
jgi:hypothetical protein